MNIIKNISSDQKKINIPTFRSGDTVRVYVRIKEGDKERLQIFEGVVLRRRGEELNSSFTVRKVSYGIGVERIFPLHSPIIENIEVITKGKVRQSNIYYLRNVRGKAARIKELRKEIT